MFSFLFRVTCVIFARATYTDVWQMSQRVLLSLGKTVVSHLIIWLAPRAGKMTQIAPCDWLPERARWSHLARLGLPAESRKKNFPEGHIISTLLTKFIKSRRLDIGLVLFFASLWTETKHAKKELGQYPVTHIACIRPNVHLLMMRKSYVVGMPNAILRNHLMKVIYNMKAFSDVS